MMDDEGTYCVQAVIVGDANDEGVSIWLLGKE